MTVSTDTPWNVELALAHQAYGWARDIFPICRSLSGSGVRQTLDYIRELLPELSIHETASGTKCFDWEVPQEWDVRAAYLDHESGLRVADFANNNLHVVSYSVPVDEILELDELQEHLYSLPHQPDAIPYVTSYFKPRWGFCISEHERKTLPPGKYRAYIDSGHQQGSLLFADLILPGRERREILFSTYICHPSMANDNVSGIVATVALARWLQSRPDRRYTYRFVFVPETIGSIAYIHRHLDTLRANVEAGFVLTCCGDDRAYSFLPSREGNTLADRVARGVLSHWAPDYISYSFLKRGSDERQYCSPGVGLPVASIMRSKYDAYPEYHTSLDDLSLISPHGLHGTLSVYAQCITALEANRRYVCTMPCEPQLGRRNLYPTINRKQASNDPPNIVNFLAYADGTRDLIDLAATIEISPVQAAEIAEVLLQAGVITVAE